MLIGIGLVVAVFTLEAHFDALLLHGRLVEQLVPHSLPQAATRLVSVAITAAAVIAVCRARRTSAQLGLFSSALAEAADGIQLVGLDGRILYSNRAIERIYGFTHDEYLGRDVAELNVDPTIAREVIFPALQASGRWTGELEVKHKDGHVFPVALSASMVRDERGAPTAMVGIIQDITDAKRAEGELRRAKDRAEAADRTKSEFLNIASHELRTPLNALSLNLQLARSQVTRGVQVDRAVLTRMEHQIRRLAEMIRDLLDATRLERGTLVMRPSAVELRSLVAATVEDFRGQTPNRPIVAQLPDRPITVEGDPNRLEQVVANLIENALKYSPEAAAVQIRLEAHGDGARLSVTDRGPGIPEGQKEKLFDRFFRVSSPETRDQPGLGLGLYIARSIVKAHGGQIGVESTPGTGSTFYFTLPRRAPELVTTPVLRPRAPATS